MERENSNLKDLKKCALIVLVPLLLILIITLSYSNFLLNWLTNYYEINTVSLGITENFNVQFKVSLLISLLSLLPLIIFAVYLFIKDVYNIRGWLFKIVLMQILAVEGFVLGSTYMSKVIMLNLNSFSIVEGYYSLNNILTFGIGIGFAVALSLQLIILIPMLNFYNLVNPKKLWKSSGMLFIVAYFISAFVTPPDLVSTFMVILPLSLSYMLGIGISTLNNKERRKNDSYKRNFSGNRASDYFNYDN